MKPLGPFAVPSHWLAGARLGKVTDIQDPQSLARVQVQLLGPDADGDAKVWARVAVPFAGDNYGGFFIPDVDTEVLVVFVGDDPAYPVVVGNLWNGATTVPESVSGSRIDRWTLTGKAGTHIAIIEDSQGSERVEIETPTGVSAVLTDESGGSITLKTSQHTITMDSSGVTVDCASTVTVNASQVKVSAGMVTVDAGFSKFSGAIQCDTIIATSVVGTSYTPGAGNVW